MVDNVNQPSHYTQYKNGQVIDIAQHMDFCLGNAVKYLMRAGYKGGSEKFEEDVRKALWYLKRYVMIGVGRRADDSISWMFGKQLDMIGEIKNEDVRDAVSAICIFWFFEKADYARIRNIEEAIYVLENMLEKGSWR